MNDAQEELESSNKRHTIVIEKYKKDLNNMKNLHAEEKLILEQQLKDNKEKHLKELEDVSQYYYYMTRILMTVSNIYIFI